MKQDKKIKIPPKIKARVNELNEDVRQIIEIAHKELQTDVSGELDFRFITWAPKEILTDYERAQSVCFITRYNELPMFKRVLIEENNGSYYFGNIHEARHVLNEYRSIIQNKKDSIHYDRVHRFCRKKLLNNDPSEDLSIIVNHKDRGDITQEFSKSLDEKLKAIKSILKHSEFGYIYNGILQHSDHKYTERFWEEYTSGDINYVFAKHALIISHIKPLMEWHYRLFSVMTFPQLGPL